MAKTTLEQWDETAANNSDTNSINIAEECVASNINNAIRENMAQTAAWLGDDTLASGTTTDLGSVPGRYVTVSGTTTITGLGTIKAGTIKYVTFSGALTLTHNATSLILPGAANIVTAAGDCAVFVSEGSGNWRMTHFQRAAYAPVVQGTFTPTLACGTSGTITLDGASVLGYVKVGKLVTVSGLLTVASVSSPTGSISLSSMPYTSVSGNTGYAAAPIWVSTFTGTAGVVWQAFLPPNSATVNIGYYAQSSGSTGSNPASVIKAGTAILISFTYISA